jgi:hypothetical protein
MSSLVLHTTVHAAELDQPLDGRYQVVQLLSDQLWGRICLALDLHRPSHPKCIIQQLIAIPAIANYRALIGYPFARESAILEHLGNHAQIPSLLASFEDEFGFYVVSEFIQGQALSLALQAGHPWPTEQVMQLLLDGLEPLAVAHSYGVRHGNLQPNSLIRRWEDNRLMLVNFNTIKQIQLSLLTRHTLFTVDVSAYEPEEQTQGFPRLASDVYAMGMMGIQALTGLHPLQFESDPQTGDWCWQSYCRDRSSLATEFVQILSRMVRHDYTQRYPSAKEALQAVQQLIQRQPIPLTPTATSSALVPMPRPPVQPFPQWYRTLVVAIAQPSARLGMGIAASLMIAGGYALTHANSSIHQDAQVQDAATRLLERAYAQAHAKDFTGAIANLKQISQDATVYPLAQRKIQEYSEKETTRANAVLEQAFLQAEQKDFAGALTTLQQIPSGTGAAAIAQEKQAEYTEKQGIQAEVLFQQASNQAIAGDLPAALALLHSIPAGSSIDMSIQRAIAAYREQLERQDEHWLQAAIEQANRGEVAAALSSLQQVLLGTSTYAQGWEKMVSYAEKQNRQHPENVAATATPIYHNLNPGSYLQEIAPMTGQDRSPRQ